RRLGRQPESQLGRAAHGPLRLGPGGRLRWLPRYLLGGGHRAAPVGTAVESVRDAAGTAASRRGDRAELIIADVSSARRIQAVRLALALHDEPGAHLRADQRTERGVRWPDVPQSSRWQQDLPEHEARYLRADDNAPRGGRLGTARTPGGRAARGVRDFDRSR